MAINYSIAQMKNPNDKTLDDRTAAACRNFTAS